MANISISSPVKLLHRKFRSWIQSKHSYWKTSGEAWTWRPRYWRAEVNETAKRKHLSRYIVSVLYTSVYLYYKVCLCFMLEVHLKFNLCILGLQRQTTIYIHNKWCYSDFPMFSVLYLHTDCRLHGIWCYQSLKTIAEIKSRKWIVFSQSDLTGNLSLRRKNSKDGHIPVEFP